MTVATADLCDRFADRLRLVEPTFRSFGGRARFAGRITTIKCFEDNSELRARLAEPGDGQVLVVDGGGSLHRALVGDRLGRLAVQQGWAGLLVYGCVRDVEALADLDLGVLALAPCPMPTDKQGRGRRDVPVTFAGVTFHPGERLWADPDGIVVAQEDLASRR